MKKIFSIFLILTPLLYFSCNTGSDNNPKVVLADFIQALSRKDMATARRLSTAESKEMIDMMESAMGTDADSAELNKFNPKTMEYGQAKINGDRATVPVKETKSGVTLNYILKKEDGKWKVAFDKSSIVAMGMEKMNEKDINVNDSINKALHDLKATINMDSLQHEIDNMPEMDSAN